MIEEWSLNQYQFYSGDPDEDLVAAAENLNGLLGVIAGQVKELESYVVQFIVTSSFIQPFQQAKAKGDYKALCSIVKQAVEFTKGFRNRIENKESLQVFT